MSFVVGESGQDVGSSLFQAVDDVFIVYWWEGREFEDFESLPPKFKSLVRRCIGSSSRYLVYTSVVVPGLGEIYGYSRCMGIDNPSKKYGRDKALGWLTKRLLPYGYDVYRV